MSEVSLSPCSVLHVLGSEVKAREKKGIDYQKGSNKAAVLISKWHHSLRRKAYGIYKEDSDKWVLAQLWGVT